MDDPGAGSVDPEASALLNTVSDRMASSRVPALAGAEKRDFRMYGLSSCLVASDQALEFGHFELDSPRVFRLTRGREHDLCAGAAAERS